MAYSEINSAAYCGWQQAGKFGKALGFDGTNDYIAMPSDATALKITSDITLSAWVNLNTNNGVHDIIAKDGASGNFGYRLFTDASGKLNMEVSGNGTAVSGGTNGQAVTGTTTLTTGIWYHVLGVYSAGNSLTIYVNGIQDAISTSVPAAIFNSTAILDIGSQNVGGSNFMNGIIDEPKVYAGALTADQVKVDMNYGQAQVLGALSDKSTYQSQAANQEYCIPGDSTTSCIAPVLRWDFEEGSYSNTALEIKDTSGSGNDGLYNVNAAPNVGKPLSGKYGRALNITGNNQTYATLTSPGTNLNLTNFTISRWIYINLKIGRASCRERV